MSYHLDDRVDGSRPETCNEASIMSFMKSYSQSKIDQQEKNHQLSRDMMQTMRQYRSHNLHYFLLTNAALFIFFTNIVGSDASAIFEAYILLTIFVNLVFFLLEVRLRLVQEHCAKQVFEYEKLHCQSFVTRVEHVLEKKFPSFTLLIGLIYLAIEVFWLAVFVEYGLIRYGYLSG